MKNFKYQSICECPICGTQTTKQSLKAHLAAHQQKPIEKICPKCNSIHFKNGIFCSRTCANCRESTPEIKAKQSKTLKGRKLSEKTKLKISSSLSKNEKNKYCVICNSITKNNRKTCSESCLSIHYQNIGKTNASKKVSRSKDEIALYELCLQHFVKITHNESIFDGWDADILIYDTKTAILWNGPWHYKEMGLKNHSLRQVQNRDKIKIDLIKQYGWTPLIFEDRYFTPKEAFDFLLTQ